MSNKKNIDRLFQEKFKDFEVTPNDAVWNRISESLPKKKKKRRVIALWWQIGGVAAAITLLVTVGVSVFNNDPIENQNTPFVDIEEGTENTTPALENNTESNEKELQTKQNQLKSTNESHSKVADLEDDTKKSNSESASSNSKIQQNVKELISNTSQKSKVAENTKTKESSSVPNKSNSILKTVDTDATTKVASTASENKINNNTNNENSVVSENEMKDVIKNELNKTREAVVDNTKVNKDNTTFNNSESTITEEEKPTTIVEDINKQSIEDAIAANTKTNNEKEEDKKNRWSIAPNVAPVYFSSLGQGSPVHSQFNENAKSSDINMSYGIAGSYSINNRLKVRAGVNRVNLNYTTSDVIGFIGSEAVSRGVSASAQFDNIDLSSSVQSVSLVSSSLVNASSMPATFSSQFVGDLDQQFGFIEVPLELEYRLIDKRFGVNFIGGFSTFFLSENEIYADINGSSTMIGEANNINSTSFSANLGLGLDYSLSKQWNFNLEPTFKYQLNTFNNTSGNFRPFFIGVYTGLSFKF